MLVDASVVEQRYQAVLMVLGGAKVVEDADRSGCPARACTTGWRRIATPGWRVWTRSCVGRSHSVAGRAGGVSDAPGASEERAAPYRVRARRHARRLVPRFDSPQRGNRRRRICRWRCR
jgi:hypothetical protein